MHRHFIALLGALCLVHGNCHAQAGVDPGYSTPSRYRLSGVRSVKITDASPAASDPIDGEDCSDFKLSLPRARYFFEHARTTSESMRMHIYAISGCGAKGHVVFRNGDKAYWTLSRGGIAYMQLLDGKHKDEVVILYCARCVDW